MKDKFLLKIASLSVIFVAGVAYAQGTPESNQHSESIHISSERFHAIEVALPELKSKREKWVDFDVEVTESDAEFVVVFWQKKNESTIRFAQVNERGEVVKEDPDKIVQRVGALNVYIDKKKFSVIRTTNTRF
jgi:hypothetical protein